MRLLASVLVLILALLLAPTGARAQSWLDQPLDVSLMSREDTATLQAALSFAGDYYGFLDGVWNQDAQRALVAYVQRTRGSTAPVYRDLEDLILDLEDERVANNWQLFYDEEANVSYLHPFALLEQVDNKNELEFLSKDKEFSMIIRYEDLAGVKASHDWFMQKAMPGTDPFQFSDNVLWITSATVENDYVAYARSDLNKGSWTTMSIVITRKYFNHLNLMASSVTVGGSPASLIWTADGIIDQVINGDRLASAPPAVSSPSDDPKDQVRRPVPPGVAEVPPPAAEPAKPPVEVVTPGPAPGEKPAGPILGTPPSGGTVVEAPTPDPNPPGAVAEAPPAPGVGIGAAPGAAPIRAPGTGAAPAAPGSVGTPPPATAEAPRPKITGSLKGSGTGFYIAPTTLVTASHVIEGCSAIAMADGTPLEVLADDSSLDVAVLGGATNTGAWLKLSALEVPKLGEAVTAIGYPYYTSLDQGLTVTSGNVSALRGADGSSNRVMITAPVQPGNSGGPLLNKKGAVIGVVVSRMDDLAVLEETGSLPQNMNFAVPSGPLLTFLAQNRITRPQGDGSSGDVSGEVPEGVANAVVPLHCYE